MKEGDVRVLKTQQLDDDERGEPRITPAGSVVEVCGQIGPDNYLIGCPITGSNYMFTEAEWLKETDAAVMPENAFQNENAFRIALAADREEAIRELFEHKVEEWMNDGHEEIVRVLTSWTMRGFNLADDDVIIGCAESLFDDLNQHDDPELNEEDDDE